MLSIMNNQAVAMARCEQFKEGIMQYRMTLEAIPDNRKDIVSIVSYNLALAYLRNGNTEEAISPLEAATKHDSVVQDKSKVLLIR